MNAYLQEASGLDLTSKDFRTWAGTVLAAQILGGCDEADSEPARRKNIVRAVESVAKRLGNTRAVCRKCYIHPAVFEAYLDGGIASTAAERPRRATYAFGRLSSGEAAVLALLQRRVAREGGGRRSKSEPPRRKAS